MSKIIYFFSLVYMLFICPFTSMAGTSGIIGTKHNLSITGPGEIHALTETRICIFCHTPHNATPSTPLWNRDLSTGVNYQTYNSTTFNADLAQPSGSSRLCLSCHDGTIALGAVKSVAGGVAMTNELVGRPSYLGTDLRDDHPFSFSYATGLSFNSELRYPPPTDLLFYSGDIIHCTTCHDPHDDTYGMFLAVDNKNTALCIKCHNVTGWSYSSHSTSNNTWNGSGNDPWPLNARLGTHVRTTVAENGCENCHTPHNAGGPQRLMNYRLEEQNCIYACHNGNVGGKDIASQINKISSHPLAMAAIGDTGGTPHDPNEDVSYLVGHVECQDCHNPHSASDNLPAIAPNVSGYLQNVKGVNRLGTVVSPASYEYEICLKCHGNSNSDSTSITRYSNTTNRLLDMVTTNPSYHPVFGIGLNTNVPSLPSSVSPDQGMSVSSMIYCTDCHDSDETSRLGGTGPVGPHGSIYPNLLRERYETLDNATPESFAVYALCYRCHDRTNILSDASFKKRSASGLGGHSGHLAAGGGVPCSVCHDPHGVKDDGISGDHTNLINFDSSVVTPTTGNSTPLFTDNGLFSGTCTLVCHGVTHDGSSTYTYP